MILLSGANAKLQIVTGSAASVEVHASYADNDQGTITPGFTNTTAISSATTTDVVAAVGASKQRKLKFLSARNDHASTSTTVEVLHNDSGSATETLWKGTLLAQESVYYHERAGWVALDASGFPKTSAGPSITRAYFAPAQAIGASRVYMTNTGIVVPAMSAGMMLKWQLALSKTAAGAVAPILELLVGANGTTADTARFVSATTVWTQAMLAQSAAVDKAILEVECYCIGAGASGSLFAQFKLNHMLAITGFSTGGSQAEGGITGSIDLSAANNIYGLVVTAGTSAAWTLDAVRTEVWKP